MRFFIYRRSSKFISKICMLPLSIHSKRSDCASIEKVNKRLQ
ncbi:hypothetical protein LEP1GSC013_4516 [Leptospira interrogans serovar Valbuzzi str. Duyster]|nr:hypothetical protein LEP1GSC013_4516 [Leptospira interrogans serovar Valbuzzi str. Duyster]